MRILLVRHGQSMGNVDKSVHMNMADHAISLSEKGKLQAIEAGNAVDEFYRHASMTQHVSPNSVRMWVSPYLRTEQTANGIQVGAKRWIKDRRQDVALVEQQFGLFDGVSDEDLPKRFPDEHAHYEKCMKFQGRFWAPMPLGESRFAVALRVKSMFGSIKRDEEQDGINDIVVVAHGVSIRAFVMQWCHKTVEWFEEEKNPYNCSVRLIEGCEDKGYIFKGF